MKDKATILTATITVALAGIMIGIFVIGNGSTPSSAPVDPSTLSGLQESTPPWSPDTTNLSQRLTVLGLPTVGNESFHKHALLSVVIDGKDTSVPNGIGAFKGGMSSFHTHSADGLIHMESGAQYPFTLGQFFDVWGVKFTNDQLGSYKNAGDATVQVFVNGKALQDAVGYKIQEKDKIVVGYGKQGDVPTIVAKDFPEKL